MPATQARDRARPRSRSPRWSVLVLPVVIALAVIASGCVMNGTWAATAPAPVTGGDVSFTAIDCIGTTWCVGVGAGDPLALVQTWNGSTWTSRTPPTPGSNGRGSISDIECLAVDRCIAFVQRFANAPAFTLFVQVWNGSTWSDVPGTNVPIEFAAPTAFSCVPGTCVFADYDNNRTVLWDGSAFTVTGQGTAQPKGYAIACVSATDCISSGQGGLMSHFDGSAWTDEQLPTFPNDVITVTDIDCPLATDRCVGVGYPVGAHPLGAAATWDGTTWTEHTLPDAPVLLTDVSCASFGECLAGSSVDGVLAWNGADWYVAPTPPGSPTPVHRAASCSARWCMAVGATTGSPVRPAAATYTWTNS